MPAEIAPQTPRTGRPCAVCALPAPDRAAVEEALAQGMSLSRISRSRGAPSRDSLRRHVLHGHLASGIQEAVERLHALDSTSLAARLVDAARRAREVQIEAHEAGDHSTVLRAVDTEVRVIGALAAAGVEHESDPEQASAHRDVTRAALRAVRANPELAHALAAELDRAYRPELAEQIRETALSGIEA